MADAAMQDRLQALFEKLSDNYVGTVECDQICPEFVDVTFLNERGVVAAKSRLSLVVGQLVEIGGMPVEDGPAHQLVRCEDTASGEQVFVSCLPSAIIAVVCR
jgi:hypothetical protein